MLAKGITGQLALSGRLRPVKGILSIALEAQRCCRQTLIVPLENAAEAAVVESVDVYGACSLSQVVHFLRGDIALEPVRSLNGWPETGSAEHELDFGEIKGQQHVKRRRSRRRRRAQHSTFGPIPSEQRELRFPSSENAYIDIGPHLGGTRFRQQVEL